ncbi:MAG: DUF2877 domain-containing protein [Candidatus Atribacteria bacterium]|nr:MAG: DUF2877 domain-containing protein [Candidatus Atribacteria bacterium]
MGIVMLLAKSIASDLIDTLTSKTVDGIVHSVFDHACNIQLDKNSLITLISPMLPNYPSAIKLDIAEDQKLCSIGFKAGMKAVINKDEIKIPEVCISIKLTGAKVWDSSPLFFRSTVSEEILNKNIEKIRDLTLKYGEMEGIASILDGDKVANHYKDFIINSVKRLTRGISDFDYKEITEASKRLIGLGPGLTPAADDFLLGILASLYYIGYYFGSHLENLKKIAGFMIYDLPGRTTFISEIMLRSGMKARFSEPIRDLMLAVIHNTSVQDKCINLLSIGETSGSDCAAGIVFGGVLMAKVKILK